MNTNTPKQIADELAERVATDITKDFGMYDPEFHAAATARVVCKILSRLQDLNLESLIADRQILAWVEKYLVLNTLINRMSIYFDKYQINADDTFRTAISAAMNKDAEVLGKKG